jgi:hypothetical protein
LLLLLLPLLLLLLQTWAVTLRICWLSAWTVG